jgi:hypothetical protein
MSSLDARGGSRRRLAALAAAAIVTITVPVGLGLRLAAADAITYTSGTQEPVVIVTNPDGTSATLPEVVEGGTGQEPVTIEDALTRRSDEEIETRITWLRPDGLGVGVVNGGAIDLGSGYAVTVTVTPYPPVNFDPMTVDFAMTHDGATVEGAAMTVSYDMRFMAHGPFPLDLGNGTVGTFTSTYNFFMFGPWQIDATVTLPGSEPIQFSISIYVWPTT